MSSDSIAADNLKFNNSLTMLSIDEVIHGFLNKIRSKVRAGSCSAEEIQRILHNSKKFFEQHYQSMSDAMMIRIMELCDTPIKARADYIQDNKINFSEFVDVQKFSQRIRWNSSVFTDAVALSYFKCIRKIDPARESIPLLEALLERLRNTPADIIYSSETISEGLNRLRNFPMTYIVAEFLTLLGEKARDSKLSDSSGRGDFTAEQYIKVSENTAPSGLSV